jgi:hypothetical protein
MISFDALYYGESVNVFIYLGNSARVHNFYRFLLAPLLPTVLTRDLTLIIHFLSRVFFNTSLISKFPPLVTKLRLLGSGITNVITVADYVGFGKTFPFHVRDALYAGERGGWVQGPGPHVA